MKNERKAGTEFWLSFRVLREAISNTPEGKGGIAALSGFSFQFLVSLEAMVLASVGDGAVTVFLETLSDLALAREGRIEVTQIKLTLSSPAAGKGLEELWKVHGLARSKTPELVPSLRYKLLGSRLDISDIESKLRKWEPSGAFDADILKEFRERLSTEIKSDPRSSLATSLVNLFSVSEPFELIDRWIGKLFSVGCHEELSERAREISIELGGLEARRREIGAEFRLWSTHDRPPAEVVKEATPAKAVLTGQMPHRDDLREGRFAPRSIYSDIAATAENWLKPRTGPNRELISALWISGRSGTGKSVALLHLLSRLHEEDPSRVIVWLGNDSTRLGEAVQWCRPFVAEGLQVILAADDPYTGAQQTKLSAALTKAKAEIESFAELYPSRPRPVMIMCGPTEQADAFEYDFSDDVRTQHYFLPHETSDDLEELRAWYVQRTGRTTLPIEQDRDVLIVQLFFEWSAGEKIASFARRFQGRLKDLALGELRGPFEIVADILALNRLYAVYPAEALEDELRTSPALEGAFKQLTEDRHFSFAPQWGGYRLIHPHLADAIYRTWFGGARDGGFRKSHLRRGIRASLAYGEGPSQWFAPLWAISRLTSPAALSIPEIADRIELIRDDLRQLLGEIYQEEFSVTEQPLVELPVWANLDAAFELGLSPSPLDAIVAAVRAAPDDAPGLRLACHIILAHGEASHEGVDAVRDVLRERQDWREWPRVALGYVRRHGLAPLMPTLTTFVEERPEQARALVNAILHHDNSDFQSNGREIVARWFCRDRAYLEFQAGFLTDFIDRWGCDQDMFDIGYDFLCRFPTHPSWSYVWERLRSEMPEDAARLASLGRDWLAESDRETSGWAWVWERSWKAMPGDAELRRIALEWLSVSRAHGSWSYVWQQLWEAQPGDADLQHAALEWLGEQLAHGSWRYTWQQLWEAQPGDADLRHTALAWLNVSRAHGSWSYIWQQLWGARPGDADLRHAALEWLGNQPEHGSWRYTWQELWEAQPGDADLRQTALEWLGEQPEHGSWRYVWQELWEAQPGDPELWQVALDWLSEQQTHELWALMWHRLWKAQPGHAELRRVAVDWLEGPTSEAKDWTNTWEAIWQDLPADARLRRAGLDWLEKTAATHGGWPYIWRAIWDDTPGDEQARQLGLHWLNKAPVEHKGWTIVWIPLRNATPEDAGLRRTGLDWLPQAPAEHKRWSLVWSLLWMERVGDYEVWQLSRDWLSDLPAMHYHWPAVWAKLWDYSGRSEELTALGLDWLRQESPRPKSWPYVWLPLAGSGLIDSELLSGIAQRLLISAKPKHFEDVEAWLAGNKPSA